MLNRVDGTSSTERILTRLRFPHLPLWAALLVIAALAWLMARATNDWRRREEHQLLLLSTEHLRQAQEFRARANRHRQIAGRLREYQQEALLRLNIAARTRDERAYAVWSDKIPWRQYHIENFPKLAAWEDEMARYWEAVATQPQRPIPPPPTSPRFVPPLDNIQP